MPMEEPYYVVLYWHNDEWNVYWAGESVDEAYKQKELIPLYMPDVVETRMIESEII